jgi:ribonuclease HII
MLRTKDQRRIVIGVDEAGYGPNIGPLIIAATAWRVPDEICEISFAKLLRKHFSTRPWCEGCKHVPLGDSKQLYTPAVGLRTLEAGLLALLEQLEHVSRERFQGFGCVLQRIAHSSGTLLCGEQLAWYSKVPTELPVALPADEICRLANMARTRLAKWGIELLAVRASIVTESNFNLMIDKYGSKGRLLSTVTMQLVSEVLSDFSHCAVEVFCDRQGGRKKYSCVLLEAMPDDWFDTLDESPQRSSYRRQRAPELKFHFSVGGDSFPPTALASMTAKYLRERLMASINDFWKEHVVDLKPTAGYPNDAKRFREQIEPVASRLGHAVEDWWRAC